MAHRWRGNRIIIQIREEGEGELGVKDVYCTVVVRVMVKEMGLGRPFARDFDYPSASSTTPCMQGYVTLIDRKRQLLCWHLSLLQTSFIHQKQFHARTKAD